MAGVACLTHSVYRSTTRRVGHTSLQPPPSRQSEPFPSFAYQTPNSTEPSLCCRFVPGRVQVRTAPVRTLNVTALWSEDVPRTTCHSSALSSRAELHAVTSTVLRRDGPPVYFERGIFLLLSTCNPPRRGSRRFPRRRAPAPPHAPCVDVAPRMILFVPSFEQTHFTRSRYGPIGVALEVDRHDANSAVPGRDYSSSDVFVDECLIFLDVHVTVQD
ncbi:hypothetical protein EVAR_40299_1 [Eumeta japonica]|uniref:Uncharacterized protein n=1 Tax=Eumeta variegata TaxID=151549 RepID=A0A4C1YA19_EUMVA|nr:hypothetical protein EVAR_40299_1 [Eumeta japonica]